MTGNEGAMDATDPNQFTSWNSRYKLVRNYTKRADSHPFQNGKNTRSQAILLVTYVFPQNL